MATFLPHQRAESSGAQPDFTQSTPPDPSLLYSSGTSDQHSNMPNGRRGGHNRPSGGEFREKNVGGRAIPGGPQAGGPNASMSRPGFAGPGGFEAARSPPSNKNTSHVPCKFFKVGQCQAGKACPFSHSTDVTKFEQPCKYFSKGNCKFGQKCALLHVLQNGRVVNRPNSSLQQLNLGGRVEPTPYHQESALGNSLAQQHGGANQPFSQQIPFISEQLDTSHAHPTTKPYDIPQASPRLGASRNDYLSAMSPPTHLSTLDAPLPASFDSQGISYMARHGPVAASVPSKFGVESPPPSLPKVGMESDALRNLRDSAFSNANVNKIPNLGSSPSGFADTTGGRVMHSSRVVRPKMMSSSMPRPNVNEEWTSDDLLFKDDEEYLPHDLAHLVRDVNKPRRSSSRVEDSLAVRESLMGSQNPADYPGRMGASPSHASPSRFSGFFQLQQQKEREDAEQKRLSSSSFGHVGSPLGRSGIYLGTSPSMRSAPRSTSNDMPFKVSSPPLASSISGISQGLQRTRLSRAESTESNHSGLVPTPSRLSSYGRGGMDRAVSSSSVHTNRIDEENQDFVFPLTLDDDFKLDDGAKPSKSPWNPAPKAPSRDIFSHHGSIGDGRRSLDSKDANAVIMPRRK